MALSRLCRELRVLCTAVCLKYPILILDFIGILQEPCFCVGVMKLPTRIQTVS